MKNIKVLVVLIFIVLWGEVYAEKHTCSGKQIVQFTSHALDKQIHPDWDNTGYIKLESCTKGPTTCLQTGDGLVRLSIPGDRTQVFSMALAAYMSDKKVSVTFDDSHKAENGECMVAWFHLDGR